MLKFQKSVSVSIMSHLKLQRRKTMNNKGRTSALIMILLLIVALIVAYLAVTQMGSPGNTTPKETSQAPVEAAKEAVNAINEQQQKAMDAIEGLE